MPLRQNASEASADPTDRTVSEQTSLLQRGSLPQPGSCTEPISDNEASNVEHSGSSTHIGGFRATCIILAFSTLILLAAANFTLMSTIQDLIADSLDAYAQVSWFTSAYLIGLSCFSPMYGRLAQIFSVRACTLCASALFAIGSLVAAQAADLGTFLAGRAIQGSAAAGVVTLSIILVIQLTPVAKRGFFIGLTNSGLTAGVSVGAVIGGELGWSLGWRPLMWIQTPISLAAGLLLFVSLSDVGQASQEPDEQSEQRGRGMLRKLRTFDHIGSLLLVSGLVALLVGLSTPSEGVTYFLSALVLLTLFVLNEIKWANLPLIPLSVLRSRPILASTISQFVFMTSRWSVLFYSPIFMEGVHTWEPAQAGAVLISTNTGFAIGGIAVGLLHIRKQRSYYVPLLSWMVIFPVTLIALARLSSASSPPWVYVTMVFVNGLSTGAGLNYCIAHMLYQSRVEHHFMATSLLATFRIFSGSFGSAVGGGLFSRVLESDLRKGFAERGLEDRENLIRHLLGQAGLVRRLVGDERAVAIRGYERGIQTIYIASFALGVAAILIQALSGWKAPGESKQQQVDEEAEDSNS